MRGAVARQIMAVDPAFSMTQPAARLLNILSNESWRVADAVAACLSLLVAGVAVVIFLGFLLALSPLLALGVLAGLAGLQLMQLWLSRHFVRLGQRVTALNGGLSGRMLHLIHGWRLIRLFGQAEAEAARFAVASDQVRRAGLTLQLRQAVVGPLVEVAYAGLFLAVVWAAWALGTTFGQATAFVILLYRLQPQVRAIQGALAALRGWSGALDEVGWLLAQPATKVPASVTLPAPTSAEGVRFRDVSFRYAGAEVNALTQVSFDLPWGESVALIGRSGSGKSTVAHLLCGLLRPTEGQILTEGIDLVRIDPQDWLKGVAVASADLDLFDGTVAENILYGASGASLLDARAAARDAGADGFIRALPDGYRARVGDRGVSFSAGQRQRLALARAPVRRPRILILDEATNALDMLSESVALQVIDRRRGTGITLMVSHQLSAIRLCDRNLHFAGGRLLAQGRTAELEPAFMRKLLETGRSG